MKLAKKKTILKKLMQGRLNIQEESALNDIPQIDDLMRRQWDDMSKTYLPFDAPDEYLLWEKIQRRIQENGLGRNVVFYRIYSWVASVLLILGIGSTAYFFLSEQEKPPMYVVSSGIQNIESVSLPDGTEVQMGPGSKLTFPAWFIGKTREVQLEGQAFFDVAKNKNKPFIVHTKDMDVQALGTAFELFSYEIENKAEAALLHGKIKVSLPNQVVGKKKEYILSPNEKILFDKRNNSIQISTIDADKYTSWREYGVLTFENEKLSMIIPRLEQWYGRHLICQKDIADQFRFTFKVKDESLERILFMMNKSSVLKYKKTENGDYILSLK